MRDWSGHDSLKSIYVYIYIYIILSIYPKTKTTITNQVRANSTLQMLLVALIREMVQVFIIILSKMCFSYVYVP